MVIHKNENKDQNVNLKEFIAEIHNIISDSNKKTKVGIVNYSIPIKIISQTNKTFPLALSLNIKESVF